ncbi:MAG: AAA family ATPase [Caldilineaceae bacterium]
MGKSATTSNKPIQAIPAETALQYLSWGWSVIPVHLSINTDGKISKRPAIKWQEYQQRLPKNEEVKQWFDKGSYPGIGVVTGKISNLVVVDIEHDATLDDVKGIESSLESQTINGGRHVFYRWTKHLKNTVRLHDKPIDFRGDGGFIVLPPSQIGNRGYAWSKQGNPQNLPELPTHIENALTQVSKEHSPGTEDITRETESPTTNSSEFPTANQGERNATATQVAGSLCANISSKLWESVGWTAMINWNSSQCHPPLPISELRSVWHSITSTHQRNHPKQLSKHTEQRKASKPIVILPWKQFRNQEFQEPEWIVENLIPEKGLVAVAGPPESCKSYFTSYLAIAVARGEVLFEQFAAKQVGVLLIDQENLPAWIQRRLMQFNTQENLPLHIYANRDAPFNLENQDAFGQVVAYIQAHQIELVILDTLRLSHVRDENSSTDMKPVFDRLKQLTQHTSVIFIQHHRKGDRKQPHSVHGEDMMGSMLIRGSVDYQLSIVKLSDVSEGVTQIKVTQTKARYTRNLKPFTLTLEENNDQLHFSYAGPAVEHISKRQQAQQTILSMLQDQSLTRQEIISQLTTQSICSARTTDTALKDLKNNNRIIQEGNGEHRYSLPTHASSTDATLQRSQTMPLHFANAKLADRENANTEKSALTTDSKSQVQDNALQIATPYISMQFAKDKAPKREKAVTIIGSLHSGDLQRRISATKKWLLQNQKYIHPQFDAAVWFRQLQVYQLLIDEAQVRGIVQDDDWLEMARMTFHTDDGATAQWIEMKDYVPRDRSSRNITN